jgi:hypothetical protein
MWRQKKPDAFKDWYAENKEAQKQRSAEYRAANAELVRVNYSKWAKENKHIVNALIAKRTAAKKNACAAWADEEKIRAMYAEAARLTTETGIRHEVDHYYPLQGELVCGLHCEENLQILTKVENIRKHNRMPEEYYETARNFSSD